MRVFWTPTTGPNDPTIVKGSDEDAFCVLMPIRSKLANDVEKHRPQDWFYPTAKPQDATEEKENCDAL